MMLENTFRITSEIFTRNALPVRENSRVNRDYVISLDSTRIFLFSENRKNHEIRILIRYVPDRLICDAERIEYYFIQLSSYPHAGFEDLANTIADDFGNDLIPRWISVDISLVIDSIHHSAHVEEKQPLWDNAGLLNRAI